MPRAGLSTYFRSDGGTGPEGFVDFEGPGVKAVETSWTLGGDGPTHFEGWVAIRILSPNSYESNQAKFVLDCGSGQEKQPEKRPTSQPTTQQPVDPQTSIPQQPMGVITHPEQLGQPVSPTKEKLEKEMSDLRSLTERSQPALDAAQAKLGLDSGAIKREFTAISEEPDPARREQLSNDFARKHEANLNRLAEMAGVDLVAQRQQVIALLGLENKPVKEGKTLAIECCPGRPATDGTGGSTPGGTGGPTPGGTGGPAGSTGGPADMTEHVFSAPYTSAGTLGHQTEAVAGTGKLSLSNGVIFASSIQKLAFISQTLAVERGIRRVRVSATFDPVEYFLNGLSLPPGGYTSAEAIVNLRVMQGSRIVASDRISLHRLVTAVVGEGHTTGSRAVTLQCEFTRAQPDDTATYTLIAEIEGWAGAAGLGSAARVNEEANLQRFQVYLHRR